MSLPGIGIGMINDEFHIAEIWLVVTERLKMDRRYSIGLQTAQPTPGGAVTAVIDGCTNCVETTGPQQWGTDFLFGQAGHADRIDGWL